VLPCANTPALSAPMATDLACAEELIPLTTEAESFRRSFLLSDVVLDPYLETRKLESRFSNKNNPARKHLTNTALLGLNNIGVDQGKWYEKKLGDSVPLVPRNTPPGFEKYALGRRLVVTKKDYIELVPKGTQKGDRVAVLMGSETPFILQKRCVVGSEVIGETYKHWIMVGAWEKKAELRTGRLFCIRGISGILILILAVDSTSVFDT
jgi:hypothetical protein